MIVSRTPFRLSFFGGGTDYPVWYREHGGSVLATTIDKYCYLSCRHLPPFFEHRIRIVYSLIEHCQTVDEIAHPAVREVLRFMNFTRGLEIHHDGDLPARSGMGSSSAFTVGLLHALHALRGEMPTKHQLATESMFVEQEMLKETVGSQDQTSAAYGGFNHIVFLQNGEVSVRPITVPRPRLDELNAHLMLFYTGLVRTASNIAESYVTNMDAKKRQLRMMTALVDESLALLHSNIDLAAFGDLLHVGWQAKRSLGEKVSSESIDDLYAAARGAGASGGKLLGAGGGGFLLLFAPPDRHAAVRERLRHLIHVPFRFEFGGSQIIFFDRQPDYSAEEAVRAGQVIERFREVT